MLGAIFGDIAGSIYEFHNIKTTEFPLLGKGTDYTDDSILVVAVANWLLDGNLTKERLAMVLKQYVRAYPNPMGSYGNRFLKWALSNNMQPYSSWGNGSAMRVAPVGWAFDSLERTEEVAALTAEVTHNDPEGIKGAQAVAAAIYLARNLATKQQIKEYLEQRFKYDLSRTCDSIRPTYQFNENCQGTVPEALMAFIDSRDFESAIRLAVSLGGDSDTLTCITGSVAEAFYGMQRNIPWSTFTELERVWFSEIALERLPEALRIVVERFCRSYAEPRKIFRGKNDSATVMEPMDWQPCKFIDKRLSESVYSDSLKGYEPDWEMRFGIYYEDGWQYIYRSHYLLKKFRFELQKDGLYHLTKAFTTEFAKDMDHISEILANLSVNKTFYKRH